MVRPPHARGPLFLIYCTCTIDVYVKEVMSVQKNAITNKKIVRICLRMIESSFAHGKRKKQQIRQRQKEPRVLGS